MTNKDTHIVSIKIVFYKEWDDIKDKLTADLKECGFELKKYENKTVVFNSGFRSTRSSDEKKARATCNSFMSKLRTKEYASCIKVISLGYCREEDYPRPDFILPNGIIIENKIKGNNNIPEKYAELLSHVLCLWNQDIVLEAEDDARALVKEAIEKRQKSKYGLNEISYLIGCPPSLISSFENPCNESFPKLDTLSKYLRALGYKLTIEKIEE